MALSLLCACLIGALAWWWQRGTPVALNGATAPIACLSYAPFRRPGATPFRADGFVSPIQIEEDLRLLRSVTQCVRTYGVGQGLDAVPQVARKLGMRVRLGAWLGRDEVANRQEIARALAISNENADVIDVVIVGNEVLLRKDLSVDALRAHLRTAKAATRLPVTYADVWEFWRANESLQDQVDWVTVHILPYWEDEPVAAKDAAAHVIKTARAMQKVFANKPIWVGETGWPGFGRQRASAVPGLLEQTRVVRDVIANAELEKLDVNLIEAFDQPWKRDLEGAMGAAWGIFRADGTQRVLLKGDVVEDPNWRLGWVSAALGGLAAAIFALAFQSKNKSKRASIAMLVFGGALLGAMQPLQWEYASIWGRNDREWNLAVAACLVVNAGAALMLLDLADWASDQLANLHPYAWQAMLFIAAWWALVLLFDSRYRGFPLAIFAAPAAFSGCLLLKNCPRSLALRAQAQGSRFLAFILLLTATVILLSEGVNNFQALGVFSLWVLLALPSCLFALKRLATTNPDKSKAGAANSAL